MKKPESNNLKLNLIRSWRRLPKRSQKQIISLIRKHHHSMNWSKVWILGLVVLIITGCKSAEKVAPAKKETNLSINLESVSLDEIQKNKGVIVVRNNMDLVMIAPTFNKMAKIYKLETKQLSLQGGLFE